MSKLVEHNGKELLKSYGFKIPDGVLIHSVDDIEAAFNSIGPGVLKAQVQITGRAGKGLVRFIESKQELLNNVRDLMGLKVGNSPVKELLYEEKLKIEKELYAGIIVDRQVGAPVFLFSSRGGSGIEQIVKEYPESIFRSIIDPDKKIDPSDFTEGLKQTGLSSEIIGVAAEAVALLVNCAIDLEAENLEVNPLVVTANGDVVAADCHLTVDDYAVFRHPEFHIEIARELGHPPTRLEKVAWDVEKNDYRGTFYFIQLEMNFKKGKGYIGFHGAGGGGSMMSMDALDAYGYKPANFCDTSGNPPASKIYRAARIILSQGNIDGYFGSGSGVASQEQYHSARGIVKALLEVDPDLPVVLRLGGNGEDQAIRIMEEYTKSLHAEVRCFGKDTSVSECAQVFDQMVKSYKKRKGSVGRTMGSTHKKSYAYPTVTGGTVSFDYSRCSFCANKVCIEGCSTGILQEENGCPVLSISQEEASSGRCIECLVCEVECQASGNGGGKVTLPIPGLEGEDW
ncbi:MAG: hypothetical protein DRP59_04420 [Spirochaetes bacterium]|nr:MAG: hypothetical protein DRP59_04420 [Spirochaetota bacterium]